MAEFPAMPLWTDAYLSACWHLSDAQHGRYILLLMLMWRAPLCRVPNDDLWLAHNLKRDVDTIRSEFRPLITEFCIVTKMWVTQKRLRQEWEWVSIKSKKNSVAAKMRWQKEKDECERTSIRICERNAPTPTPIPIEEESKKKEGSDLIVSLGKTLGRGEKQGAMNGESGRVTVSDPKARLGRFMNKIAHAIQTEVPGKPPDYGWSVVLHATDTSHPGHQIAISHCRDAARALGKGWPKNWPVDGNFFSSMVVSHEP